MKLARYAVGDSIKYGSIENDSIREIDGDIFGDYVVTNRRQDLSNVRLLAPCQPSKIVALGVNYLAHAEEMHSGAALPSEPLMFLKPPTCVINPGDDIILPGISTRVDFEAELVAVIKDKARNIMPDQVYDHILGYTCGNDVTARDLQSKDGQWTRGKGFDTFAPLGPWIVTDIEPSDLKIELLQNGEVKQSSTTGLLIFNVQQIVSAVSRVMTLLPGDVVMTGTPSGVGPMKDGDTVEVRIQGIGSLINRARKEEI
jgi:2-keto-4-pentenoate hydratase/2-oxohepta-3-ene-1,7-dioic acid hydratase in catechol pathway